MVEKDSLTIQFERLYLIPKLVSFDTCKFVNTTHVNMNHHKLNETKSNCNMTRLIESSDYFYNKNIILIIDSGLLGFSCSKNMTLFVNTDSFMCTKKTK